MRHASSFVIALTGKDLEQDSGWRRQKPDAVCYKLPTSRPGIPCDSEALTLRCGRCLREEPGCRTTSEPHGETVDSDASAEDGIAGATKSLPAPIPRCSDGPVLQRSSFVLGDHGRY
jgi:hypothetical protein